LTDDDARNLRAPMAVRRTREMAAVPSTYRGSVLVLGASVSQLPAIRKGRALGLRIIAVDADARAVGFAEVDVAECVDFSDVDRVVEVARRHRVDGVVAISTDRAVPVAAAVADALGLPGIGHDTALAMTDKGLMRSRLATAGIPQPAFVVIGRYDDPAATAVAIGFPAVVKPADSGGQRGLFRIESVEELRRCLPKTLEFSRTSRAILEEFVDGLELNVMAVVIEGAPHVLTVSDRLRPPGRGFGVGWAHLFPSHLPPELIERAEQVSSDAIIALGLRNGIAFPQLLVSGGNVRVVEVAARVAAGQMADLVRHGIGVDLIDIAFALALGERLDPSLYAPRLVHPIAIRLLTACPGVLPTGRVRSVKGLDTVRRAPGILDAGLYIQPGEVIKPVQVDADRRGYIIATARTPSEALTRADDAARHIRVDIEAEIRASS
jgi:biotin carboxylase